MSAPNKPAAEVQQRTFEQMMIRLQELVSELERGDLPLDDSIKSFAEGVELVKKCNDVLDKADKRIQELTRDIDGRPTVKVEEEPASDDDLPF